MNARRAARELALLAFSQLRKDIDKLQNKDIEDIIVVSVRTLVNESENNLKTSVGALINIRELLENYEFEHPENIKKPMGTTHLPVPIPLTSDMLARIDTLIDVADKSFSALEIIELSSLTQKKDVMEFTTNLVKKYSEHKDEVDSQISKLSRGWNIDRLVRIDRDILRLAITELLYIDGIPVSVSIDEAVELAKKYSTDESSSFINGILRQVVEENKLSKKRK